MKFVIGRLSFSPLPQLNLFSKEQTGTPIELAEGILRTRVHYAPPSGRGFGFKLGDFLTISGRLVAAKLGVLRDITLRDYDESRRNFVESPNSSYDTLFLLWDRDQQVILLQHLTTVHRNSERLFEHIELHLNNGLHEYGLAVKIWVIPETKGFWRALGYLDAIISVRLRLSMPNLFGKTQRTLRDWLTEVRDETNANEITTEVSNSEGHLVIKSDNRPLNEALNWIDKGGGEWSVAGRRGQGRKITLKSSKTVKRAETQLQFQNYTSEEAIQILNSLKPEYLVNLDPGPGDDE